MRSSSRHSPATRLSLLTLAPILLLFIAGAAQAGLIRPSVAQMARIEASGEVSPARDAILFHGYRALGLRRDAAHLLERRLRSGALSVSQAAPRFAALLEVYGDEGDPDETAAVCRMADRNHVRTSPILFACGTTLIKAGNERDATPFLGEIGPDDPFYPFALQALGQAAAARQDYQAAAAMFKRAMEHLAGRSVEAARAALAQAECLLLLGRGGEAVPLFEFALSVEESPVARAGLRSSLGNETASADAGDPSDESIATLPARKQIFYHLLEAARARNMNRFPAAFAHLDGAKAAIDRLVSQPASPGSLHRAASLNEALRRRIDAAFDGGHTVGDKGDIEQSAATGVDLILGLLVRGRLGGTEERGSLSRAPGAESFSQEDVGLALDRLEEIVLRGETTDRLAESISVRIGTLENIAHPIGRYRLLAKLENHRNRILEAGERVREQRIAVSNEIAGDGPPEIQRLLRETGRMLDELETIGRLSVEADQLFRDGFDIFREKADASEDGDRDWKLAIRKAIDFERVASSRLSRDIAAVESSRREELLAWERGQAAALRSTIACQEAETHVAQARFLLEVMPNPGLTGQALDAALRGASFLEGGRLSPEDRLRVAVGLGFVAAARQKRWVPFSDDSLHDGERSLVDALLPVLDAGGGTGQTAIDAAYLAALFGLRRQSAGAGFAALKFMRAHPGTERAADLSYRLAVRHVSAGNYEEAAPLLDIAASSGGANAAPAARALIGLLRLNAGDYAGSVAELSVPLSDQNVFCGNLSSFESEVLDIAARAWRELPLDGLEGYPPIRDGRCGGRMLLEILGDSEDMRGEPGRACQAYELLQRLFRENENSPLFEAKEIEARIRLGQEQVAVQRILKLAERFGPDTAWWLSAPSRLREGFRGSVVKSLRRLSDSLFAEGTRNEDRPALGQSAGLMGMRLVLEELTPDDRDELRFRRSIATVRSGERKKGLSMLRELADERRAGLFGERVSCAWLEETIAGHERNGDGADGALDFSIRVLREYPSARAASLAWRVAVRVAGGGDIAAAVPASEAVAESGETPPSLAARARLLLARAALSGNDPAKARKLADIVLGGAAGSVEDETRTHAKELFALASLKEAEVAESKGDPVAAAAVLESLIARFPADPDSAEYMVRAAELRRSGGDFLRAADLYAESAARLSPGNAAGSRLFLAASLSADHGSPEVAAKRFASYRKQYALPRWKAAFASLFLGLQAVDAGKGTGRLEEGIKMFEGGVEDDAPAALQELCSRARLSLAKVRIEEFGRFGLSPPVEKSIAVKDRLFRRALEMLRQAGEGGRSPVEVEAVRLSGDLLVEFGKQILSSPRPKGLPAADREAYEKVLRVKARAFIARGREYYASALTLAGGEPRFPGLTELVGDRVAEIQELLAKLPE